jgi:hypothetical protein
VAMLLPMVRQDRKRDMLDALTLVLHGVSVIPCGIVLGELSDACHPCAMDVERVTKMTLRCRNICGSELCCLYSA